jgi:hypothetical protein
MDIIGRIAYIYFFVDFAEKSIGEKNIGYLPNAMH